MFTDIQILNSSNLIYEKHHRYRKRNGSLSFESSMTIVAIQRRQLEELCVQALCRMQIVKL